jgi:hypothetical protein
MEQWFTFALIKSIYMLNTRVQLPVVLLIRRALAKTYGHYCTRAGDFAALRSSLMRSLPKLIIPT